MMALKVGVGGLLYYVFLLSFPSLLGRKAKMYVRQRWHYVERFFRKWIPRGLAVDDLNSGWRKRKEKGAEGD